MNIKNKFKIIDINEKEHYIKEKSSSNVDRNELFSYVDCNITLNLKDRVTSLFAPNGSGKTTLRKLIYASLDLNFDDFKLPKGSHTSNSKNQNVRAFNDQEFYQKSLQFKYSKGNFFSNENNVFFDLNKILSSKKEILLPWEVFFNVKHFSLSESVKPEVYNFNSKYKNEFIKYDKDINNIHMVDYSCVISHYIKEIVKENIFVESTNYKYLESNYNYFHYLYHTLYSLEVVSSMLKIPIVKFLEKIKNNEYEYTNIQFKNVEKDQIEYNNCYKWFSFIPKFLLDNPDLLSLFIDFSKEDEIDRNKYKQVILNYNNMLENNLNNVNHLFKKYFPNFFNKISFKKRYSSLFDCELFDLEFINLKNESYFLQEFYEIASEGEIKILNLFILLLEFDKSTEKFNFLLGDDFLSSFDNTNVTIILRVLEEFLRDKNYYFLSLTHDFEIYRIFNNVFNLEHNENKMLKLNKNVTANCSVHKMTISEFSIRNDFYVDYLKTKKISNYKIDLIYLLSMLSHYRNIVEIYNGTQEGEYLKVTNFLHLKDKDSQKLLDIFNSDFYKSTNIIKQYSKLESEGKKNSLKEYICKYSNYYDLMNDLFEFTEKSKNWDKNTLEAKIFYSLYSRIMVENWLFEFIKKQKREVFHNEILSNQTEALISIVEGNDKEQIFNGTPLYEKEDKTIQDILICIKELKQIIPNYMHIKYNEISYLVNIDVDLLYEKLIVVKNKIKMWYTK